MPTNNALGEPTFAKPKNRAILGKLALGLALLPWVLFGGASAGIPFFLFGLLTFGWLGTPIALLMSFVAVFVDRPKGFAVAAAVISGLTCLLCIVLFVWLLENLPFF